MTIINIHTVRQKIAKQIDNQSIILTYECVSMKTWLEAKFT